MTTSRVAPTPELAATTREPHAPTLIALWSAALGVAALGTALLFRAGPGVNWALVTLCASIALVGAARMSTRGAGRGSSGPSTGVLPASLQVTLVLTLALTTGAMFTADAAAHILIVLAGGGLLATGIDLARAPCPVGSDIRGIVTWPIRAGARLLLECLRRLDEALLLVSASRSRPVVRGVVLAVPVVLVFSLMLAGADPLLASARDQLVEVLTSWDALPRILFFVTLLLVMAGAGGRCARGAADTTEPRPPVGRVGIGAVERAIVLGAVALLFAGFLVLQASYLFATFPGTIGSGVTFAEYARRGFAELTTVASLCLVLIAVLDHGVNGGRGSGHARLLELALLGELMLLLASAFRRLLLYEDAYGFTTARLYGQAYMVWLVVALGIVAVDLRRRLDAHRIIRRGAVAAVLMLITLIYWNHEAWIVQRNVARVAAGRQLDVRYAVWSLSPNAVPALVVALDALPPDTASSVRLELLERHGTAAAAPLHWYEWNLRRIASQRALSTLRGQ